MLEVSRQQASSTLAGRHSTDRRTSASTSTASDQHVPLGKTSEDHLRGLWVRWPPGIVQLCVCKVTWLMFACGFGAFIQDSSDPSQSMSAFPTSVYSIPQVSKMNDNYISYPDKARQMSSSGNPLLSQPQLFPQTGQERSRPYPIRAMSSSAAAHIPFVAARRSHSQSPTINGEVNGRGGEESPDSVSSSASAARFGVIGGASGGAAAAGTVNSRWGGSSLKNTLMAAGLGSLPSGTATRSNSFSGLGMRSPRVSVEASLTHSLTLCIILTRFFCYP